MLRNKICMEFLRNTKCVSKLNPSWRLALTEDLIGVFRLVLPSCLCVTKNIDSICNNISSWCKNNPSYRMDERSIDVQYIHRRIHCWKINSFPQFMFSALRSLGHKGEYPTVFCKNVPKSKTFYRDIMNWKQWKTILPLNLYLNPFWI